MSQATHDTAHWEHGYRCHGYWNDTTGERMGRVGIGPRPWDGIYRWELDGWDPGGIVVEGECRTLRTAKKRVEQAIQERGRLKRPINERDHERS